MRRRRVGRVPATHSTSTRPATPKIVGGSAKIKRNEAFPWNDGHVRSGRGRDLRFRPTGEVIGTVDRVDISDDGGELWVAWTSEQHDASLAVEATPDSVLGFWLIPRLQVVDA